MKLLLGDCLSKLKELEDNSIDSIVTDPPYGLSFMGKDWDKVKATKETQSQVVKGLGAGMKMTTLADNIEFEKWVTEWSTECYRVLKPGGYMLAFGGSRMYHRLASGVENAGFEIRDQMMWIYGSGFPKSRDIGKDIEKIKVGGIKNLKQIGTKQGIKVETGTSGYSYSKEYVPGKSMGGKQISGDIPVYEITNEWGGWGTALKPAHEPIVMARKPLSGKTVGNNVLEWGTGGINIDDSRIGNETGRFPANVIFDEEAGKMLDEQSGYGRSFKSKSDYEGIQGTQNIFKGTYGKNTGQLYDDSGGASRFFYCPKTSKKERNDGTDNNHPTVKPTDLMLYLIRLVTPKGGVTLDPFMGSGSTGKAAIRGGFNFIGIEREKEYMEIAESRINYEINNPHKDKKVEVKPEVAEKINKFFG